MGKIYKLNKGGSVGVSLNKQMKAAGYEAGKEVVFEAVTGGFLIKLKPLEIVSTPSEPKEDASPAPPQ